MSLNYDSTMQQSYDKYRAYDDKYFEAVDTEHKAYAIGKMAYQLYELSRICIITSQQSHNGLCSVFKDGNIGRHLGLQPSTDTHKKDLRVKFLQSGTDAMKWVFLRAIFDAVGRVSFVYSTQLRVDMPKDMFEGLKTFVRIPYHEDLEYIYWSGINAIDLLYRLYDKSTIRCDRKYQDYTRCINWAPPAREYGAPTFRYFRMNDKAIAPTKVRGTDSGYDLWLVELIKEEAAVKYYSTGLKVQPDPNYYFELVGRSSISKTGHMLANNIGIIDIGYDGPIIAAIRKVDPSAPDLTLPCRIVQIIPRQRIHLDAIEGETDPTQRGAGGFGST